MLPYPKQYGSKGTLENVALIENRREQSLIHTARDKHNREIEQKSNH